MVGPPKSPHLPQKRNCVQNEHTTQKLGFYCFFLAKRAQSFIFCQKKIPPGHAEQGCQPLGMPQMKILLHMVRTTKMGHFYQVLLYFYRQKMPHVSKNVNFSEKGIKNARLATLTLTCGPFFSDGLILCLTDLGKKESKSLNLFLFPFKLCQTHG